MTWYVARLSIDHMSNNVIEQGILDEVWKQKLIFVETPDANETSIALENYRRVAMFRLKFWDAASAKLLIRHATTGGERCYFLWPVERFQRGSILTITMAEQSSCSGEQTSARYDPFPRAYTQVSSVPYQYTESRILRVGQISDYLDVARFESRTLF